MILRRVLLVVDLGPLGLYKEIYKARAYTRDSYTSCATETIDYLTHPLSFELFKVKAKLYSTNFCQLLLTN
jgi:hypothetical protein